ncbi:MAG: ATPase domain-containing protein [Candidatus Altiarchaeota archaeon]
MDSSGEVVPTIERVPTGVDGLDSMLEGGFLKRRHVLISGGPGTGKTTFGYQYLYMGAETHNERGLFVSLEQSANRVVEGAKALFNTWNWDKHLNENIIVTRIRREDFANIGAIIEGYVNQHNVKRIVLDSTTLLRLYFRTEDSYRNNLYELLDYLGGLNCTAILLSEKSYTKRGEAQFDIEEFITDGVINLYMVPKKNNRLRVLEIIKMRDTNHSTNLSPFTITPEGILVSPTTGLFTQVE